MVFKFYNAFFTGVTVHKGGLIKLADLWMIFYSVEDRFVTRSSDQITPKDHIAKRVKVMYPNCEIQKNYCAKFFINFTFFAF